MAVSFQLRRISYLFVALIVTAAGCGETDQIRTYSAPKEIKPVAKNSSPDTKPGDVTDRMLAAILPVGEQAYFFKLVGPIADVDAHAKEVNDFFEKIQVSSNDKPKWQIPDDWKEQPASAMRLATITIPTSAKPLEISVTALPWTGGDDSLLQNVNRWRGQLQLPPIKSPQLAENVRDVKIGDHTMSIVDLRGHFASSGMTPPFAGAAGQGSTNAAHGPMNSSASNLPPGHPPIDLSAQSNLPPAHPPIETAAAEVPKFDVPADWKSLPAGGMRKAAFAIGDSEHGALVTLISFPATEGPMIADPLQNVNRWRREVGLDEVKQDELSKATESIQIDGQPATYVHALAEASQADQLKAKLGTLAAMLKSGDQIWFIKLTGDRSVVAAQEDAFKNFLKSLRFAADRGATDGHK